MDRYGFRRQLRDELAILERDAGWLRSEHPAARDAPVVRLGDLVAKPPRLALEALRRRTEPLLVVDASGAAALPALPTAAELQSGFGLALGAEAAATPRSKRLLKRLKAELQAQSG